jgi:hypothetical protein
LGKISIPELDKKELLAKQDKIDPKSDKKKKMSVKTAESKKDDKGTTETKKADSVDKK